MWSIINLNVQHSRLYGRNEPSAVKTTTQNFMPAPCNFIGDIKFDHAALQGWTCKPETSEWGSLFSRFCPHLSCKEERSDSLLGCWHYYITNELIRSAQRIVCKYKRIQLGLMISWYLSILKVTPHNYKVISNAIWCRACLNINSCEEKGSLLDLALTRRLILIRFFSNTACFLDGPICWLCVSLAFCPTHGVQENWVAVKIWEFGSRFLWKYFGGPHL